MFREQDTITHREFEKQCKRFGAAGAPHTKTLNCAQTHMPLYRGDFAGRGGTWVLRRMNRESKNDCEQTHACHAYIHTYANSPRPNSQGVIQTRSKNNNEPYLDKGLNQHLIHYSFKSSGYVFNVRTYSKHYMPYVHAYTRRKNVTPFAAFVGTHQITDHQSSRCSESKTQSRIENSRNNASA